MIITSKGVVLEDTDKEETLKILNNGDRIELPVNMIEQLVQKYNGAIYYDASDEDTVDMIRNSSSLKSKLMYPLLHAQQTGYASVINTYHGDKFLNELSGSGRAGRNEVDGRILTTVINRYICNNGVILYAGMGIRGADIEYIEILQHKEVNVYVEIEKASCQKRRDILRIIDTYHKYGVDIKAIRYSYGPKTLTIQGVDREKGRYKVGKTYKEERLKNEVDKIMRKSRKIK